MHWRRVDQGVHLQVTSKGTSTTHAPSSSSSGGGDDIPRPRFAVRAALGQRVGASVRKDACGPHAWPAGAGRRVRCQVVWPRLRRGRGHVAAQVRRFGRGGRFRPYGHAVRRPVHVLQQAKHSVPVAAVQRLVRLRVAAGHARQLAEGAGKGVG